MEKNRVLKNQVLTNTKSTNSNSKISVHNNLFADLTDSTNVFNKG